MKSPQKKLWKSYWEIFENYDNIGDFWKNFDKLHIFILENLGETWKWFLLRL